MTIFDRRLSAITGALLGALLSAMALELAAAQDRGGQPSSSSAPSADAQQGDEYEEIEVRVGSMAAAGRILREVGVAKAREGIPADDAWPRFDTENNILYFRTSTAYVPAMRRILASLEAGGGAAPSVTTPAARPSVPGRIYSVEVWIVQLELPKGEVVELKGPRGEVLTTLAGLEKEGKASILNHMSLSAEEGRAARSTDSESIAAVNSITQAGGPVGVGGFGGRRGDAAEGNSPGSDGAFSAPPRRVAAAVERQVHGTQVVATPTRMDGDSVLLELAVSKSFQGKAEEGTLVPVDSAGAGYRIPAIRLFEMESVLRAPVGAVITGATQLRGGEKPIELRVLVYVDLPKD